MKKTSGCGRRKKKLFLSPEHFQGPQDRPVTRDTTGMLIIWRPLKTKFFKSFGLERG
jgi:hypothetical protein